MKDTRFVKNLVWLNGAVPAVLLGVDAWRGRLGANPLDFATKTTGLLAMVFLVLSLCVTPLARHTPWKWLGTVRRALGLYAFYYALLHLAIFFVWDRQWSVGGTLAEVWLRPYLLVGSVGLLAMVPLAVTSTNGMIKRVGPKRWKALHRLAYVAAIAGVVHYSMQTKADVTRRFGVVIYEAFALLVREPPTRPLMFACAVAALLLYRLVAHYVGLRAAIKRLRAERTAVSRT